MHYRLSKSKWLMRSLIQNVGQCIKQQILMSFAAAPHTAATKVSSDAHVDLLVFGRGKRNHVVITAKSVVMLSVLQPYTLVLQTHTSCYIPLHLVLFCNGIIHLWTTKLST